MRLNRDLIVQMASDGTGITDSVDIIPKGPGSQCELGLPADMKHPFNFRYATAGFVYEICPRCGTVRITEAR